jgi:VWFA-related protein
MQSNFGITRRGLLALPWVLRAQEATFSTDVRVVNLQASVTNKRGEIVRGLTRDDFLLEDEGRPQAITYFSQEGELPLTLGLLLDVSGSQDDVLDNERRASLVFFNQVLRRDRDRAFVVQFARTPEFVPKGALEQTLTIGGPRKRTPEELKRPSTGVQGSETALYDAIVLAAGAMRKATGRKAMVILSDGVDAASSASLTDAIETAQRADTLIYSVLFAAPPASPAPVPQKIKWEGQEETERWRMPVASKGSRSGKPVLERISSETAGTCFLLSPALTLSKVFTTIGEELRHQYSLGFTPERTDAGPAYRRIKLKAKPKGLVVRTRKGYYAS